MTPVQEIILDIYKATAAVCRANGIPYCAIGGTCIGAVRHKGFIPWDDDMDIAVPVEEFDRFLACVRRELPKPYNLVTYESRDSYDRLFVKIENTETTFIEESELRNPDAYKGIFLDIMPLGGIPSDPAGQEAFIRKVKSYHFLNRLLHHPFRTMTTLKLRLMWPFVHPLGSIAGKNVILKKWMAFVKRFPAGKSGLVGYVWSYNIKKRLFRRSWFDSFADLPFEDTTVPCPVGYDAYLTAHFGDYMTLPPAEQQTTAHQGIIDTQTPYRRYRDDGISGVL